MKDYWKIGSSTVRSAGRLEPALVLIADHLEGKIWNGDTKKQFFDLLITTNIYDQRRASEKTDPEQRARTWISPLYQLGFLISKSDAPIKLTSAGNELLKRHRAGIATHDVWFWQLCKFQLPNGMEEFSDKSYAQMELRPFVMLLDAMLTAQSHNRQLTIEQIGHFLLRCFTEKEYLRNKQQQPLWFLESPSDVHATAITYADTTARYAAMTGAVQYDSGIVQLNPDRLELVIGVVVQMAFRAPDSCYLSYLRDAAVSVCSSRPTRPFSAKSSALNQAECAIEFISSAITISAFPRRDVFREPTIPNIAPIGLFGSAFELLLGSLCLQAWGEDALIRPGNGFFKSAKEIYDDFNFVARHPQFFQSVFGGDAAVAGDYLDVVRNQLSSLKVLIELRAAALHAARGCNSELLQMMAHKLCNFLSFLAQESALKQLYPWIPKPLSMVEQRVIILEDILRQLNEATSPSEKILQLSSLYLILPEVPPEEPDWLKGIERFFVSPSERDISYLLDVVEKAYPGTLMKVNAEFGNIVPTRVDKSNPAAIPISAPMMRKNFKGFLERVKADVGTANGALDEGRIDCPKPETVLRLLTSELTQWLRLEHTDHLSAQDIWPFIIASFPHTNSNAIPGPYCFLLKATNDHGQLRTLLTRAFSSLSASKTHTGLTEVLYLISRIEGKSRTNPGFSSTIQSVVDEHDSRGKKFIKLVGKKSDLIEKSRKLGDEFTELLAAMLSTENAQYGKCGVPIDWIIDHQATLAQTDIGIWISKLSTVVTHYDDIHSLIRCLAMPESLLERVKRSQIRKAIRVLDIVTFIASLTQ